MPNQNNNKIYRIANHLQVVYLFICLLLICCSYTFKYVRSINFVACTSASNFLEYIKILPVNKIFFLYISYIYERRKKAGSSTLQINQVLGEKYQDFQCNFYLKNKRNHKISVLKPGGVKYIVESLGPRLAEIFFGITFFGSLVTAPVMMQYHCEACTAGNRLRSKSNTLTRLILYTYSHNRCGF